MTRLRKGPGFFVSPWRHKTGCPGLGKFFQALQFYIGKISKVGTEKNFKKKVDPGQLLTQHGPVMKNKTSQNPPAAGKAADLQLVPEMVVDLGGGHSQKLLFDKTGDQLRYSELQKKYPAVHDILRDVAAGVYQVADNSRKAVLAIINADMKHEDSSLMLRAWGYGKDRVSLIHRIVDAAPKTREAYLKGDMGLKKAVMEARLEGEGEDSGRGGKRGSAKKGGTKAQREELTALAETVAKEVAEWLPSKLPIKTGKVRLGSYPWLVELTITHKPMAEADKVDPAQPEGKK